MIPEQDQLFQKAQQSLNAAKYLLTGGYYDFAEAFVVFYASNADVI